MLIDLVTAAYYVPDLEAAKAWLKQVFEIEPYFDEPFYVGYNVGGCELGLQPNEDGSHTNGPESGVVAYWRVADMDAAWATCLERGAQPGNEPLDVGGGIRVATVLDPFGNPYGLIENPHFVRG